jgi:phytoene dehydrogenase-like protein
MIFHFIFMPRRFQTHHSLRRVARPSMFFRPCLTWASWRWIGNLKVPGYADKILAYLEKHYMSDLRRSIVIRRLFTPDDFRTELNSRFGSAFSLEPRLLQSAYFRVHNRDRKIRGLYFVGAGTHPGAGIPGVVNSAKATANLILHDMESLLAWGEAGISDVSYA